MRKTLSILGCTILILALIDFAIAGLLGWADGQGRLGKLVNYFEYGRSVPGKLTKWEDDNDTIGNLYDVAWRLTALEYSTQNFAEESMMIGPVVRSYGMSFVGNILKQAHQIESSLRLDIHAGPSAPPNYTYAQFLDDRTNRRAGDIVVLGILSSSVPAMDALSNQTWSFEQPAPYTYPIFRPDGYGLRRIEPLIESANEHRTLKQNPDLARAWAEQLSEEDAFYSPITYGAPWLDFSPFVRLVRRSLAVGHIQRTERRIVIEQAYPYSEVLRRMIEEFAKMARADGQMPVVMLIQSRDPGDPDLLQIARPVLAQGAIPYLATAEYFNPRDPSGFQPDSHYKAAIDREFGKVFLNLIASPK